MKKVVAILTAVILVLSIGTTAFAAEFIPSVVEKEAPTVVEQVVGGVTAAGTIVDKSGQVVETISPDRLIITPVSKVETSTEIPKEAADKLKEAYEQLSKADVKLSDLIDELDDDVKEALGNEAHVDHLIIRDLFDASLVDANGELVQIDAEHRLVVKFNIGIEKGKAVFAMKYNENNEWEPVTAIHNNGDGTVTCEFDHLCPIAFLVEDTSSSAQTGDNSVSLYVWVAIAAVAAGLMVVLVILKNKKEKIAE